MPAVQIIFIERRRAVGYVDNRKLAVNVFDTAGRALPRNISSKNAYY